MHFGNTIIGSHKSLPLFVWGQQALLSNSPVKHTHTHKKEKISFKHMALQLDIEDLRV